MKITLRKDLRLWRVTAEDGSPHPHSFSFIHKTYARDAVAKVLAIWYPGYVSWKTIRDMLPPEIEFPYDPTDLLTMLELVQDDTTDRNHAMSTLLDLSRSMADSFNQHLDELAVDALEGNDDE